MPDTITCGLVASEVGDREMGEALVAMRRIRGFDMVRRDCLAAFLQVWSIFVGDVIGDGFW